MKASNYLHTLFEQGCLADSMKVRFVHSVQFEHKGSVHHQPLNMPAVCLGNHIRHLLSIFVIINSHFLHWTGTEEIEINHGVRVKIRSSHTIHFQLPVYEPVCSWGHNICFVMQHPEAPLLYAFQWTQFQAGISAFYCAAFPPRYNLRSLV